MKLDPEKVIAEVDLLNTRLEKALKTNLGFSQIHQDIINLCELVFTRKSDYSSIATIYPADVHIEINFVDPSGKKSAYNKDIVPDWPKEHRKELADNCFLLLKAIRQKFVLRAKLSDKKQVNLRKEIEKINQRIDDIISSSS